MLVVPILPFVGCCKLQAKPASSTLFMSVGDTILLFGWMLKALSKGLLNILLETLACSDSLAFLDAYQGPLQWQTSYNLIVLRHISFAMDKYWARTTNPEGQAQQQDTHKASPSRLSHSQFATRFSILLGMVISMYANKSCVYKHVCKYIMHSSA